MALEYLNIIKAVKDAGLLHGQPTIRQTIAGTHAASSEHYAGRAVDFGVSQNGADGCAAIFDLCLPFAQAGVVDELFYDPKGGWKKGQNIGPIGGHSDHVHVGVRPGYNLALAMKAKPIQEGTVSGNIRSVPIIGGAVAGAVDTTKEAISLIGDFGSLLIWVGNPDNQKRLGMGLVAFLVGLEALLLVKKGLD